MKFLAAIFVFFCLFPYIDILHLGTDTQPNAMLAGLLLLAGFRNKRINVPIVMLWVLFTLSLLLIINAGTGWFNYFKNCMNYLSPAVIAWAGYNLFIKTGYRLNFKFFLLSVLTYGAIGIIQISGDPYFMTFLVNDAVRGVLTSGRGVVSLTPEPAFYGSMCIFMAVFSMLHYNKKQNLLVLPILLAQMIFLSQSATAIVISIIAWLLFTMYQLLRFRMGYLAACGLLLLLLWPSVNRLHNNMQHTRTGQIFAAFVEDPALITRVDGSVGIRFTGAVTPFLALFHKRGMPMGLGHYEEFLREHYVDGRYRSFLTPLIINEKERLGGSANMVIYQLGLIGLLFPLAIWLAFRHAMYKRAIVVFAWLLFTCLMFTQVQLMHSMTGLVLAAALFAGRQRYAEITGRYGYQVL